MENFETIKAEINKYGFNEIADFTRKCNNEGYSKKNVDILSAMVEYYNTLSKGVVSLIVVKNDVAYNYETMARNSVSHVGEVVVEMTVPGLSLDGVVVVKPRVTTRK